MKIKEGSIITGPYCKPTDGHQYLYYESYHADHMKRSIIVSQTLRLKRICSEKNNLNVHVEDFQILSRKRNILTILLRSKLKRPLDSLQVMKIIAKK